MDRDSFIQVLQDCIGSATGRQYRHIDWTQMSNEGLIECAELVRDLLEKQRRALDSTEPEPQNEKVH